MVAQLVLTTVDGGNFSLLQEDGGVVPVVASTPGTSQGTFGNFSETFSPVALAAALSPAALTDVPYTPSTGARAVHVSVGFSGTMDAAAAVQVQLQRLGSGPFGPVMTIPAPGGAGFQGTIAAIDTAAPLTGPRAYQVILTSAGHTFTAPVNAAGFAHFDL
jgi:hypothetical protein